MRFGEEKMVQYKDSYFLFYLSSSLTIFHLFYWSKQVELFPFLFFFSPFSTIQMEYCWQGCLHAALNLFGPDFVFGFWAKTNF